MIKVIAEIGCNHKGNFEIAKKMIRVASDCGASIVKFQKRNNIKLSSLETRSGLASLHLN